MNFRIAVIMDPIESIKIKKDTTFAILLEAQARDWRISYLNQNDLYLDQGKPFCTARPLTVFDDSDHWFEYGDKTTLSLGEFDVILMRKDPPFNMEYIYTTYILDLVASTGTLVINNPTALRSFNEKMAVAYAPQCCTSFCVSSDPSRILEAIIKYKDCVLKPLDGMGGQSIFHVRHGDDNTNAIIESLTANGRQTIMVQKYIPEIRNGDKRVLIINGEPVRHALARIPKVGDFRGNLAAGGSYKGVELNTRDLWICDQLKPLLINNGLFFVGIDIIGDYLTEINITSPTCVRELDAIYSINISALLIDAISEHTAVR